MTLEQGLLMGTWLWEKAGEREGAQVVAQQGGLSSEQWGD